MESSTLDVLIVNPGDRKKIYQSLGQSLAAIEPPIWASLIASFVRKRGYSVRILDANAEGKGPEETALEVSYIKPILTVVVVYGHNPSASTQVMPAAGDVCREIKRESPESSTLMLGGHVAALPERTLREEQVDFVCGDEGFHTVIELLETLRAGSEDYTKVRGLWFRDGKEIVGNAAAPLIRDLDDEVPGMAWDLLPMNLYRAHNWHCFDSLDREPYAAIYTTLGCPYHCTFCCIQAPFKRNEKAANLKPSVNSYRFWSPDIIVSQIDYLVKELGVRNIKFADEMFVLNQKHVDQICDSFIERGYDLNIWAYARIDSVKDSMIAKLKSAGVNWLAFGIEAADESVRDDVQKGFGQDLLFETLTKVTAGGIYIGANYIFGLPEDNLSTMQATLDLALELNAEYSNFYCTMAYPGSALYDAALASGLELPKDWSGYSQHSFDTLPLATKYLSAAEVIRFRDQAFDTYFTSETYQAKIMSKFGQEAVTHIREMAAHTLKRKFA
jgi:anaerobic magnesium-protoporphyrin IX monomethyl ester cyclase